MIQVDHLTKDYAGARGIIDVSFSVEKGEIVGFLGPNGAGKTTTMRILTGYLPPSSGSATIAGFDIEKDSVSARRHIGYLPENVPLYTELTVLQYLDYVARLRGIPRADRMAKIERAVEKANIGEVRERTIGKLSKGFRQRVGIAQAVIHEPDVMILDEPTEGLDPRQRNETRDLIRELGKEHTVILSTHILPEVEQTCDRILVIHEGKIVGPPDTPQGLARRFRRQQRIECLVSGSEQKARSALGSIQGISNIEALSSPDGHLRIVIESEPEREVRHQVARALVGGGIDLYELRAESVSLEEIFLRLTTSDVEATARPDRGPGRQKARPAEQARGNARKAGSPSTEDSSE
jgi:ABC-2 type transport system ATP-binding protein